VKDFIDDAVFGRSNDVLHLHRDHHHQRVAGLDLIAVLDVNLKDRNNYKRRRSYIKRENKYETNFDSMMSLVSIQCGELMQIEWLDCNLIIYYQIKS
jgi:hypothetical protein